MDIRSVPSGGIVDGDAANLVVID
ncbi:hypothetical protein LCGC14_2753930, partial [marine sediment metagenome]